MVLFPYKQDRYNNQVIDILNLYLSGHLVFCPGDGVVENRFATEQILRVKKGEEWPQMYSGAAIESAVRIIMAVEGSRPGYVEERDSLLAVCKKRSREAVA